MVCLQFVNWRNCLFFVVLATLTVSVTTLGQTPAVRDTTIPTMEGVNCLAPQYVLFPIEASQVNLSGLSTCQHFNDYNATCLGSYDGGEDYIIQLEVRTAMHAYLTFDPHGTNYTGIAIDNSCPPDFDCLAFSTSSGSQIQTINNLYLEPGLYYIMVDTWPSPTCIPDFDIQIIRQFVDPWGVDCAAPFYHSVTASSLPLTIGPASTIASLNDFSGTCLDNFDEGEDVFYRFDLPESLRVSISIDPQGVAGSGFVLNGSCPPTLECIVKAMDTLGVEYGVEGVSLPAGTYYLMVDTWSMSTRLNPFFIHVEAYFRCGDTDGNDVVSISDVVYLLRYIFAGGPAPSPIASGDVNSSGGVSISDAVYLINYIFAGGAAPCGG
jgi:hypothetical protein